MNTKEQFEIATQPRGANSGSAKSIAPMSPMVVAPRSQTLDYLGAPSLMTHIEVPFVHKWLIVTCVIVALVVGWGACSYGLGATSRRGSS